ncbi:MAG: phosphate ABC transporter permease PstA [Verrucomicrobiota bacterium]|jgi:phosphate transport system permease protein|nr:phosphate ABC transporter permease PstA [Verrucomicrobiota bacterium]
MTGFRRKAGDIAVTCLGYGALLVTAFALLLVLTPILTKGAGAVFFRATSEHRRMLFEQFRLGDEAAVRRETLTRTERLRPVYEAMARFEAEDLPQAEPAQRREWRREFTDFKQAVRSWAGPLPGEPIPTLLRGQYGAMRLDHARRLLHGILVVSEWDYPTGADGSPQTGRLVETPRETRFAGTTLAAIFPYLRDNGLAALQPRPTCFYQFFFCDSRDAHFFGGIWPELKGTLFLTLLSMLFVAPVGILTAVYLAEYTRQGRFVALVRVCVNTLAGVPSIVFGLFGLAFFILTLRVSPGKSALAGSLTLALLALPTMIRSAEEAIAAVPTAYREAARSLGAGKWQSIVTVVLPAALPGILTGAVICMGRVAGETAPIIFTAAVSAGSAIQLDTFWRAPTPALPWGIYSLVSEHEAADALRHVQYGMVAALVLLVLSLNLAAVLLRTRLNKRLHGA